MKIAIIGTSFRLPNDVNSLDHLKNILSNKINCISNHPKDRFNIENYDNIKTNKGGYISNIYDFDSEFFKISPKEAKSMDPQQRHMMEIVYECFEDAKISMDKIKGTKTGVYMGSCSMEYFNSETEETSCCNEYFVTGGLLTLLSNRISYFYDLKGPSLTLDTACSSSGHALHLACQSIINGESEMCIVGGSNILLSPETFVGFSQATMLSPDGSCKAFDESADGYVRGEGFITFLLKPLENAIRDNNKIYGVINKTGVNQDGKTPSITMPNPESQIDLLEKMYDDVNLEDVVYIEAHGTGTQVGDYNETLSIGNVLGKNKKDKLNIGSIKTNIGHLESASGLASLLKICLMLQEKKIYPNLNFNTPNPKIDFDGLNLKVVDKVINIENDKIIMGINNFGFGGSNFHCIIQNYNQPDQKKIEENKINNIYNLLAIHGSSEESINKNIYNWLMYEDNKFMKYLYNANKKEPLEESKIFVIKDKEDLERTIYSENNHENYVKFSKEKLNFAFVFCGQGAQHINMGYHMCESFPIFKKYILKCDKLWKDLTNFSFIEKYKLFLPKYKGKNEEIPINKPIVAQPATFFYQIALFELYKSFNLKPSAVIGHSAGELASFYAAGVISLEDCITFAYYRSILQNETFGKGNMLVINNSFKDLEKIADLSNYELACVNDADSIVLTSSKSNILNLKKKLDELCIFNAIIKGDCPFHSSYQDIIKDRVIKYSKNLKFNQPKICLISTTLGKEILETNYTDDYWWKNIRDPVLFFDGIKCLNYIDIFVEIGPHPILKNNIKSIHSNVEVYSSSHRKKNSALTFMNTLAYLWAGGNNINLENFGIPNNKYYPKYNWNHKEYKNIPLICENRRFGRIVPANTIKFEIGRYPYIEDHIIDNNFIFPTVGYIDLIIKYFCSKNYLVLEDLEIYNIYKPENYIELSWEKSDNLLTFFSSDSKVKYFNSKIFSRDVFDSKETIDIDSYSYNYKIDGKTCYDILKEKKYNFKDNIKSIDLVMINDDECLIKLKDKKSVNIHPAHLDAGLLSSVIISGITNNITFLPTSCKKIEIDVNLNPKWIKSKIVVNNIDNIVINVDFYSDSLNKIGSFVEFKSKSITEQDSGNMFINHKKDITISSENLLNKSIHFYENYDNDIFELKNDIIDMEKNDELNTICFKIADTDSLKIGFLRTFLNESKKDIYLFKIGKNNTQTDKIIKNIVNSDSNYKEFLIENDNISVLCLEKFKYNSLKYNYYYVNKIGRGVDNIDFIPILDYLEYDYDVVVKPYASALNFKDIMVNLDIVSENYIGYEACGIVLESNTDKFKKGDDVIVLKKHGKCISNLIHCKEDEIFKKPNNLSYIEASSIGIIFCTVYICLIERANIKKDDFVLIHSATGGVGQAAIQICNMLGAKIITTAGTEEKRKKLREEFNIEYISDSRNPDIFKKDILNFTNNEGVDVILNSLSDKSLLTNFEIIKNEGTIIEIGKRDSLENNKIDLNPFLKSITYTSVHFDRLYDSNPRYIHKIFHKVIELFDSNILKPIDIETFHISEISKALKYMSKGIHTGKIVLNIDDWLPDNFNLPEKFFDSNKYYLITGGLGGLGSELINWMYEKGATKFIITSRSGKLVGRSIRIFKELENKGCEILIKIIDITNYLEMKDYFESNLFDIDGIFHLAGTIEDKLIKNINNDDINKVLDPKVKGCLNLEKLLKDNIIRNNLKYFVVFSSITSLLGNPGQSAYVAANCFLNNFCRKESNRKSIILGAIGGVGMIHNDYNLSKAMMNNNFSFIHYRLAFDSMLKVLLDDTCNEICITNQNWNNLKNTFPNINIFSNLLNEESNCIKNNNLIKDDIEEYIKKLLEIDNINLDDNLTKYGIDSIMSIQLSTWLKDKGIMISQLEILQGASLNDICNKISIHTDNKDKKDNSKIKIFNKRINKFNLEEIEIEYIEDEPSSGNFLKKIFFSIFLLIFLFLFFTPF